MSFKSPLRALPQFRAGREGAMGLLPLPVVDFALAETTFTARMAKRAGNGPFAAAPIVQGDWDGSGTPDTLYYSRGSQLGNATQFWYDLHDPYQGTEVMWWTPEKTTDAGMPECYAFFVSSDYSLYYWHGTGQWRLRVGGQNFTVNHAITAGTTYCICASWDTKNTIDGTNYARLSLNDVHSYGITTQPTASAPGANIQIGSNGSNYAADAIVEGRTRFRRVLDDGDGYGQPLTFDGSGYVDELAAIYAAGAGADPLSVVDLHDYTLCVPTDSAVGILATGNGNAHSYPRNNAIGDHPWMEDGYMGTDWAVAFNGTTTSINCGSDVDIDDIQDNEFTLEAWIRADGSGEGGNGYIYSKNTNDNRFNVDSTNNRLYATLECATTNALTRTATDSFIPDGKWYHVTMYFNDAGDRKIYVAIDGVWESSYTTQTAGVGAIVTDAGANLFIGNNASNSRTFDGAIGWVAISNNDRHTVGTDFFPPRTFPGDDANYLASWNMNDGTGANIANTGNQGGAGSGAANRDGTATNHTWQAQWNVEATPVVPQSVSLSGTGSDINFGSGALLDDLPDNAVAGKGQISAEVNFRCLKQSEGVLIGKTSAAPANGWYMSVVAAGTVRARVNCVTDDAIAASISMVADDEWHTALMTYDETGDRRVRLWIDGVLEDISGASVGNYVSDATKSLKVGAENDGDKPLGATIGWLRVRDDIVQTDNYVPNARDNPPANDGNTQLLITMTDGAGATAADTSGNGYDGTITNGTWNNTPDMSVDEPGEMVFQNGYSMGSDGAGDGIGLLATVAAETDYVCRVPVSYPNCGNGQPRIQLYDNVGAAIIVSFDGPLLTGQHSGANNSATLTDAGIVFPASLIGAALYNITDGSSTTITAVGGTNQDTLTGVLAGGTDDDWDTNDVYRIVPVDRLWCEPIVFRTPAGCTQIDIRALNQAGTGVLGWHEFQIQESLLENGDHESLTGGNPDLITGWTNQVLDAGDTEAEAVVIHSGAQSLEWNVGAVTGEFMFDVTGASIGDFTMLGGWMRGDGATGLRLAAFNVGEALLQYSLSVYRPQTSTGQYWDHAAYVFRSLKANTRFGIQAVTGATGDRFSDDVYAVELNAVALTATPASEANSAEGLGRRGDGRDGLVQTTYNGNPLSDYLSAIYGHVRFDITPRHSAANAVSFDEGNGGWWGCVFVDANNWVDIYWSAANTVTLRVRDGGVETTANWAAAGAIDPATAYTAAILYTNAQATLTVDGVVRATVVVAIDLGGPPVTIYYGSDENQANQVDAVFAPPTP